MDMDDSDWYSAEVYVRGTNLLAKFSKQSGNVKTDYQYYTQNAHGDVVNLTDSTGAITKSYKYDAFGVEQNVDDADDNAFRYCGEYFDAETGTIYLRARYYDPAIGRFISRDSVTGENTDPLSLNLYTYCHNNPIIGTDPSGHALHLLIGAAVGALISGGITLVSEIKEKGIKGLDMDTVKNVAISSVGGAIGGALAASGVGLAGQIIGNAAISAGSNLAECAINKHPVDTKSLLIDTAAGAIGGLIGGSGAKGGKLVNQFKSSKYHLQFAKKASKIAEYKSTISSVKRASVVSTARYYAAAKISGFLSGHAKNYKSSRKKTQVYYPNTVIRASH